MVFLLGSSIKHNNTIMKWQFANAAKYRIPSVINAFIHLDMLTLSQRYMLIKPKNNVKIILVSLITKTEFNECKYMLGSVYSAKFGRWNTDGIIVDFMSSMGKICPQR